MIDHEAHLGEGLHGGEGRRQLARAHQDVVGEAGLADGGDPALDVVSHQPFGVGLVVDLVPDGDQVLAVGSGFELGDDLTDGRVGQVHPSDGAGDEIGRGCDLEEVLGLLEARDRLDHDRPVDAVGLEPGTEIPRTALALENHEIVGHPVVVVIPVGRVPEVMMGVDGAGHVGSLLRSYDPARLGVGASGCSRPSAFSSAHRSSGISTPSWWTVSSRWEILRTPATTVATAGWA